MLVSCLPVMGRHRPLWLVFACYGLCIQWNYAASVMGASQTWIDIGCDGFLCLLWASRPGQVTQCLLWPSVEFFLGYPPSPLCGSRYPALIMLFTEWVLICCSFTEFLSFMLQLPILLCRSSPFHLSYQPVCSKTQS